MESWSIDVSVGGRDEALVLRRDMGANMSAWALDRGTEFALLHAAVDAGVRAPRPRWRSADGAERARFRMERLPGESVGRKIVKDPAIVAANPGAARRSSSGCAAAYSSAEITAASEAPPSPATEKQVSTSSRE